MSLSKRLQNADGRKLKIALAVLILGFVSIMYFSFKSSLTISTTDTAVTISYRTFLVNTTTYTINYADIQQVILFEKAPAMRKVFGGNMAATRVGTFSTPDLGEFKAAINDINRPLLYIRTKEQGYMVSPIDAPALKQTIESNMTK